METKYVRVPFEVELAKKITEKSVDGKIVTRDGRSARIICWDFSNIQNIVSAISQEDGVENVSSNFNDGTCCLSSKCDEDLFIEIPEYMTFKDGDVLTYRPNRDRWCIFIYKGDDCGLIHNYVTYDCDSSGNNILTFGKSSYTSTLCEQSTESEKQSLIEVLKASKEPKAKEYLKRFFCIEQEKPKFEFNPFDKVLVRDNYSEKWSINFFSYMKNEDEYIYCCLSQCWKQCVPYNEQTAHLLGTTENYE